MRSLRLDLLALGIGKKNAERILSPLEIAAEINAAKTEAQDQRGDAPRCEPGAEPTGGPE
jgi:hypothetical protein